MHSPDISIIVPIYKVPSDFLKQCLDSLKNQTIADRLEVIIVDDGSSDEAALSLCETYSSAFTILHKENGGVSTARNMGMEHASGSWISFVDSDDWCEPNMFEKLLKQASHTQQQPDIIVCDCIVNLRTEEIVNHFFARNRQWSWNSKLRQQTLLQIMGKNRYYDAPEVAIGVPWGKLYNAAFLRRNKLKFKPELKRMQDNIFNLYAFDKAENVIYTPECLYHYRKFEDSRSNRYSPDVVEDFEKVLNCNRVFLKSISANRELWQGYYSRVIQSFHSYMRFWLFNPKCTLTYHRKSQILTGLMRSDPYSEALKNIDLKTCNRTVAIFSVLLKFHAYYLLGWLTVRRQETRKAQSA